MMSNGPNEAADRVVKYPAALSIATDLRSKRVPFPFEFTPVASTAECYHFAGRMRAEYPAPYAGNTF